MSRLLALLILPLALALPASPATGQKKKAAKNDSAKILYTIPLVVRPGEKQKLALRATNVAAVESITVEGCADAKVKLIEVKKTAVPNNFPAERVGDSEIVIELELPKDAKPGAVKLLIDQAQPFTLLLRDDLPPVAEKEPNDGFAQAQLLAIPAAIEGTIKGERDPDMFRFEGKKGERLRIEAQAARWGSPVDGFLTLYDADRRVVDSADDSADGQADPVMVVTLPRDGAYFLSMLDAHDLGGANFGYRLVIRPEK